MTRFSETIHIINGNPYVRPPDRVLEKIFLHANKRTSPIPVRGTINTAPFTQSLVRYEGDWRLYVNIIMAKAAQLHFSKSISEIVERKATFEIEFNPYPSIPQMVSFLREALEQNPGARTHWENLPPHRKKEVLRYFEQLQSEAAKARNLEKLLEALSGKETRFMARTWKNGK
jgi:hypothetical protein